MSKRGRGEEEHPGFTGDSSTNERDEKSDEVGCLESIPPALLVLFYQK
jgi:hypothetical protein